METLTDPSTRKGSIRVLIRRASVQTHLARKSKTQNWLAYRLGISSGYMSQLMSGIRCPSPKLRTKMLDRMGGEFDDWFEITHS